jgi:hypothetical protein
MKWRELWALIWVTDMPEPVTDTDAPLLMVTCVSSELMFILLPSNTTEVVESTTCSTAANADHEPTVAVVAPLPMRDKAQSQRHLCKASARAVAFLILTNSVGYPKVRAFLRICATTVEFEVLGLQSPEHTKTKTARPKTVFRVNA